MAKRTEPNWELLAEIMTPEYQAARRAEIIRNTAAANSARMRAAGEADCIRVAGGVPSAAKGRARKDLIAEGRKIKARQKARKAAPVKALHARRVREAMPPWADREAIVAIYREAQRITEATGIPHEVDHIEPLLGKNASGLHWEGNLRIVTRTENRRKGNKRTI